ncbi:MAG TPA: diguanylate cyclase, partial [Bryobacteraceae bacterium]|nr:diguanylate cyclase [Bryobacteraceae bacterium]
QLKEELRILQKHVGKAPMQKQEAAHSSVDLRHAIAKSVGKDTFALVVVHILNWKQIFRKLGAELTNAAAEQLGARVQDVITKSHAVSRWDEATFLALMPDTRDAVRISGKLQATANTRHSVLWEGTEIVVPWRATVGTIEARITDTEATLYRRLDLFLQAFPS